MSKYDPVKRGDRVILYNPTEKVKVAAIAREDWQFEAGRLAHFNAWIEHTPRFPGIEALTVNTNFWNVYKLDDPDFFEQTGETVDFSRYEKIYGAWFDREVPIFKSNN